MIENAPSDPAAPAGRLQRLLRELTHRDHTRGRLVVSIGVLALPAIFTSSIMAIYQLADLRFLGQLGGDAVAAAGATTQTLRQLFQVAAFGLSVAIQMMIAFAVGRARLDDAARIAGQSMLLTGGLAVLAILTVGLFPEFFVSLIVHESAVPLATTYARIIFLFFALNVFTMAANGVLVGSGDAATPMLVGLLQVPVAIVAEWALAFGHLGAPPLGVAGIALGTVLGGAASALVSGLVLFGGRSRVHLRWSDFAPDPVLLRRIAGTMWQPAIQMISRSLMIMVFMTLAGGFGSHVQAAYTIGLRIEMIAVMIAFPIANACATLVGQNLGARDPGRAWRAIFAAGAIEVAILVPASGALFLFRDALVGLFTTDPMVAVEASEYLGYVSYILGFWGVYFVAFRALQAAGDMVTPMAISLVLALGVGAPLATWLSASPELGASGLWIANVAYSAVNATLMLGWLATGRWTRGTGAPRGAAPA